MYIEVKGLEQIEWQDLYDYHEQIVEQFKNEYQHILKYEYPRTPNIEVVFNYNFKTEKFTLVSFPQKYKFMHTRLLETDQRIMKWF